MTREEYMEPGLLPQNYNPVLQRKEVAVASDAIKVMFEERLRSELNMFKHSSPFAFVHGTGAAPLATLTAQKHAAAGHEWNENKEAASEDPPHSDHLHSEYTAGPEEEGRGGRSGRACIAYGVNDDLDGSDENKAVLFHVTNIKRARGVAAGTAPSEPERYGFDAEVVQSLAKWKRLMLKRYSLRPGEGFFCESTSIRKGYKGDVTHSNICDQWDWEIAITPEQRTVDFLKDTVRKLYGVIKACEAMVCKRWPGLQAALPEDIHFVTSEELHEMWPEEGIHGRENRAVAKWGAVFILGMGWPMRDGSAPEEVRAPDYDDWNLNGDIMVRHPVTGYRHELSSMGIRVDADALQKQLAHRSMSERLQLDYHNAIIEGKLPLCMGGGIGISRLLMLLLQRGHIGEVQVGIWADAHHAQARKAGLDLIPDRVVGSVDDM